MLTKEQNERLTRVGAGTPGGELLRRYWLPVSVARRPAQTATLRRHPRRRRPRCRASRPSLADGTRIEQRDPHPPAGEP